MDTFETIRTVLSVRDFQDKPIPENLVHEIVEAAHLTASSRNSQPWHFIVVQNKDTLQQLGAMAHTGPYIAQAPLAIVVVIERSPYADSDTSRAIQSMILTAWSEGIGSNWVGFHNLDSVKLLLHIPEDLDILAIVPFGYPVASLGAGKKQRKPLKEIAHHETFDQPFE